jgi:hypothetical protein
VTTKRLDRVSIFGDQLSFLIPHEWVESDDEEGASYLYHAPSADSGWLRVSLISIKRGCSPKELRSLLNERALSENGRLYDSGHNIVVAWKKKSHEDGSPIVNFWWAVGHYHDATLCHEAMFSFTVVADREKDAETIETVALLSQLIAKTEFGPSKSVSSAS